MTAQEISFIENDIQRLMKKHKVPGVSIALIENGEIIGHNEYGVKNSKTHDPIDSDTIFEAASLSKPVFAYAVLQMVERGKFHLDTPLTKYLPYSDVPNDERLNLITARVVLAHTTGFPNWRPTSEALKIHFLPGEKFSYSGEGFVYLQKVIEHLSGQTIEDYIKQNIFIPLEMMHSSYVWQNKYEKLKALGHDTDGHPMQRHEPEAANAAFTLHTTALDYAKFVIAIMKDIGLKPEIINQMITPQIKVEEGCVNCIEKPFGKLSEEISWGLGWGLQLDAKGECFWHWGDNGGFKCYVAGYKLKKKGIVILTNGSNGLTIIPEIVYKFWGIQQPAFDWLNSDEESF